MTQRPYMASIERRVACGGRIRGQGAGGNGRPRPEGLGPLGADRHSLTMQLDTLQTYWLGVRSAREPRGKTDSRDLSGRGGVANATHSSSLFEEEIPLRRADDIHVCECTNCSEIVSEQTIAIRALHHRMNLFMSRLDERQRRWYAALVSESTGYGGDRHASRITGLSEKAIRRGRRELEGELAMCPPGRVRNPGGGRPSAEDRDAVLEATLARILGTNVAHDNQGSSRSKRPSLRQLSIDLALAGHPTGRTTIKRLLRKLGYPSRGDGRRKDREPPTPGS